MYRSLYYISLFIVLVSCSKTLNVENKYAGKLTATHKLVINGEKRFPLDAETARRPVYMQLITAPTGERILTWLNSYNNSIYFYNYTNQDFIRKLAYEREGANAILRAGGYYIKNMDSIYVYNMPMVEIALTDSSGTVKKKTLLRNEKADWMAYLPQYLLSGVNPILEYDGNLIFTGQSLLSLTPDNIDQFKFAAYLDMQTDSVNFRYTYPEESYGSGANWEGGLPTQVYPALLPNGEMIHSFPASHDLYITKPNADTPSKVYAGSNVAGTIHPIDFKNSNDTPRELVISHYLQEDMYGAILHDPYRKVYYRFLLQGVPDATASTPKEKKPVIIVLIDEQFNYLGETNIGTGEEWYWNNSFVTEEGLNIEYIEDSFDEDSLTLKTFTVEAI